MCDEHNLKKREAPNPATPVTGLLSHLHNPHGGRHEGVELGAVGLKYVVLRALPLLMPGLDEYDVLTDREDRVHVVSVDDCGDAGLVRDL